MQVRELLSDDDAVSPVIGVILMVAITVILAAVIASFVLGLGDQQTTTPTTKFTFDYDEFENEDAGNLTVTHDGGDSIKNSELFLRGNGFNDSYGPGVTAASPCTSPGSEFIQCGSGQWEGKNSSSIGDTPAVVAGDSVTVHVNSDYEVRVVYEAEEGSDSATLAQNSGPDA